MNLLSTVKNDIIKKELENYILNNNENEENIICSLVYKFARKLPYSMDYLDENFIPGDFLNVTPTQKNNRIFKYYNNIYGQMIDWGDSLKSGVLLQVCVIFQKMLCGIVPHDYELKDEDFSNLGISNMTSNQEYNYNLFETLKKLPEYYTIVNASSNIEDRRKALDEIYLLMKNQIGQKVGGMRRTEVNGSIIKIQESKAITNWSPYRDLEMLYCFSNIDGYGMDCSELINKIMEISNIPNNHLKEKKVKLIKKEN